MAAFYVFLGLREVYTIKIWWKLVQFPWYAPDFNEVSSFRGNVMEMLWKLDKFQSRLNFNFFGLECLDFILFKLLDQLKGILNKGMSNEKTLICYIVGIQLLNNKLQFED
ncbi:hypothetical protein RIR_jg42501.t1 [Rhizophagus irregularis DAOM 181602=DAOM 197198]|nr:hypothetical protein RIR_jg42501.t1 [Rhizophagus irregularis DAOM 181602=DAOM 197198]